MTQIHMLCLFLSKRKAARAYTVMLYQSKVATPGVFKNPAYSSRPCYDWLSAVASKDTDVYFTRWKFQGNLHPLYKYFPTSCILFTEWLFCPKFAKFRHIQLDIIDYILFMNQHCAKFYTNTRTNMETTMLSIFCDFCKKFEYFAPKANLGHIKTDILIYILCKVM